MALNAAEAYRQQSVQTNNPARLLLMVFEAAIAQVKRAKMCISDSNVQEAHNHIIKAEDLVGELITALDFQYEISGNLASLYQYIIDQLVAANVNKDVQILDEVLDLLNEMHDTWSEAAKSAVQSSKIAVPARSEDTAPAAGINVKG